MLPWRSELVLKVGSTDGMLLSNKLKTKKSCSNMTI